MNRRTLLQIAATLLLAALGVQAFFYFFEKRSETVDVPKDPLLARNAFRAAELFLARMGVEVKSFEDPRELGGLPPENATLLLPTARSTLSPQRSAELVDWVQRGGHLIVVTWSLWGDPGRRPDPILDPLGLHQLYDEDIDGVQWIGGDEAADEQAAPDEDDAEEEPAPPAAQTPQVLRVPERPPRSLRPEPARAHVAGRREPLRVQFDPRFAWNDSEKRSHFSIGDARGTHLVQVKLGAGEITALTDAGFLSNEPVSEFQSFASGGIANFDHAELLYRLVTSGSRRGPVYMVWSESWPGLRELVLEHAWRAVASGLLLLAAWVWMRSRRLGPLLRDAPRDRRQLMEHVDAAGRFDWRNDAGRSLVASVREALLDRVKARHPAWAALDPSDLARRLSEISGVPASRIARALGVAVGAERPAKERESFVRNIATLEAVRRAL